MAREYAGTQLGEIRDALMEEGFSEVGEDLSNGFTLWRPFDDLPRTQCVHVTVWPRAEGGYWCEEY